MSGIALLGGALLFVLLLWLPFTLLLKMLGTAGHVSAVLLVSGGHPLRTSVSTERALQRAAEARAAAARA